MKKKMSAGLGLSQHFLNREDKKVGVDFSGKAQDGECFRNDASILFSVLIVIKVHLFV